MKPDYDDGYAYACKPRRDQNAQVYKGLTQLLITLYFFFPAAVILTLNATIVWKLKLSLFKPPDDKTNTFCCFKQKGKANSSQGGIIRANK